MGWLLAVVLSANPTLEVTVTGLRSDLGEVRIALFATTDGWPEQSDKSVRRAAVKIINGRARVSFDGLEPGRYAAVAFHDEDGDGRLTRGLFGLPKEGWGASNEARGALGPDFGDAAFQLSADTKLAFRVGY